MSDDILNHVAGILSNASNNDNDDNTHAQPQLSMDDIVNAVASHMAEQFCVYGGPTMVDPVPGDDDVNIPDPLDDGLMNPYEDSDIYGGPTMPDDCTGDTVADGPDGI